MSNIRCPNFPKPQDGHGWIEENEVVEPQWSDGPILPDNLIDLLHDRSQTLDSDANSDEEYQTDSDSDEDSGDSGGDDDDL